MLSKYLDELYNNNNRDPDPTRNPNEKFWNPEPGPEPGLIIFWTLDPYPNPQYQFCKTQKPDPPLNFIGFSSLLQQGFSKGVPYGFQDEFWSSGLELF